jgi:hypothetical protein
MKIKIGQCELLDWHEYGLSLWSREDEHMKNIIDIIRQDDNLWHIYFDVDDLDKLAKMYSGPQSFPSSETAKKEIDHWLKRFSKLTAFW